MGITRLLDETCLGNSKVHVWITPKTTVWSQQVGEMVEKGGVINWELKNLSTGAMQSSYINPDNGTLGPCALFIGSDRKLIGGSGNVKDFSYQTIKQGTRIEILAYTDNPPGSPDINDPNPPPEPTPTPTPTQGTGGFRGYVTANGQPLYNALVSFEGKTTRSTVPNGEYILENCPLMSSLLRVELSPYDTQQIGVTVQEGQMLRYDFDLSGPVITPPPLPDPDPVPTPEAEYEIVALTMPLIPPAVQVTAFRTFLQGWLPLFGWELIDVTAEGNKIIVHSKKVGSPFLIPLLVIACIIIFGVTPLFTSFFNAQSQAWSAEKAVSNNESLNKLNDLKAQGLISDDQYNAALEILKNQSGDPGTGGDPIQDLLKMAPYAIAGIVLVMALNAVKK